MISEPTAAPAAASLAPSCDVRLATRISKPVNRRLRLAALVRQTTISQLLDHVLDQALPPVADLAAQIQGGARDD